MDPKCWLIGEGFNHWFALFQAASRGCAVEICRSGSLPSVADAPSALIAVDLGLLRSLAPSAGVWLRERIEAGATCYVRGGFLQNPEWSLSPLVPIDFRVILEHKGSGHLLTHHPLLPAALRGESLGGYYDIRIANGLSALAQPLVLVRTADGSMATSLFAIEHGAGVIICDLAGGGETAETPASTPMSLLSLLEDVATRRQIIGPLVAFDRAAGRDPDRSVGCNIAIDDRPISLDYFNVNSLRGFLGYLRSRCPGVRVDFGWTPDQTRPSHRYVETAKQFDAGFFWHGMLRHVDHRSLSDPERDLALGRRAVKKLSQRYHVRFQPVMVFPYEKDTDACVTLLKREGFIAKAQIADDRSSGTSETTTAGVNSRAEGSDQIGDGFVVLARDPIETITRDRMLARAALGMPIIAAGHPRDAGLRRFARIRPQRVSGEKFDHVVDFFAAKKLCPGSLEDLARDALAARANPA